MDFYGSFTEELRKTAWRGAPVPPYVRPTAAEILADLKRVRAERTKARRERLQGEIREAGGLQKALASIPEEKSSLTTGPRHRPSPPIPEPGSKESQPWYIQAQRKALEKSPVIKKMREPGQGDPEPITREIIRKEELVPTGRAQELWERKVLKGKVGRYGTDKPTLYETIKNAAFLGDKIKESKEMSKDKLSLAVAEFLRDNPFPDDKAFHAWAESKGIDTDEAEAVAYALATKFVKFVFGGRSKSQPPADIDPDQLKKGIEVEQEHIDDPVVAEKIAIDHLTEFREYYTALDKMESELKRKGT